MAEFPALPLWTDAYLSDTRHLTQAQHGGYLLLLLTAWRTPDCSLPDDDVMLARFAGTDLRTWRVQKQVVMQFFTLGEDGRWRQKRLSAERAYVVDKSRKRASAGRQGGIASAASKALKENDTGQANVEVCSSKIQAPTPTPTPTSLSNDKDPPTPRKRGGDDDPRFEEFWAIWPRKVAKEAARKKWIASVKIADPQIVIAAATAFAAVCQAKGTEVEYIPHPSTWLHQRRWSDHPAEPVPDLLTMPASPPVEDDDEWRRRAREYRERGNWKKHRWGPDLLSRDCRVPQTLRSLFTSGE